MVKMMLLTFLLLVMLHIYLFTISSYFLSTLLTLEAMVLILLIFSVVFSFNLMEGLSMYLFILTLSVCEASIGLTLLISLVKVQGNDFIKSYNSMIP
uniref:NADH-ubiquinone oxidoreductase chain 4L n=1 Tax=Zaptyx lushanensis TaxID=1885703 RepID=A0A224ACE6_9EUPU|nr:NADH dehydrogenase subunit 4L [Zaptyx lushanensis]